MTELRDISNDSANRLLRFLRENSYRTEWRVVDVAILAGLSMERSRILLEELAARGDIVFSGFENDAARYSISPNQRAAYGAAVEL